MTGSNRRPPACKAGALPAELIPRLDTAQTICLDRVIVKLVGLVGFEPTTPALSRRCSNRLSYRPNWRFTLVFNQQPISVGAQKHQSASVYDFHLSRSPKKPLDFSMFQKGGDPAAPSDTATLLRLHPSHEPCRGNRPPCG